MPISPASSFGHLLKEFRRRKKLTQQQLAIMVEMHRNSVSLWERELERPETMGVLLRLAYVLDLDEEEKRALIEARFGTLSLISLYNIPYNRNSYFTGREQLLKQLHQQFTSGNSAMTTQALIGLGGIGKTQIALEYAYRHQESYHDIFWINADTPETILSTFVEMARQLWLPEKNEKNEWRIVEAVKRWLRSHKDWLLIFDNVEDLSTLKTFLPAACQGSVLITTRLHILSDISPQTHEILPMPYEESIPFLLHRTGFASSGASLDFLPSDLLKPARALVKAMAGLPLALDQAGAYIERTGCSMQDYQQLYQKHQLSLLDARSEANAHPSSVVKTFLVSFERISQVNAAAADLLCLCVFLASESIPEELFMQGAAHLGPTLSEAANDSYLFNQALGDAFYYSLLQRQPQNHTFSLHRLVQVVLKALMDEATRTQWLLRALNLIASHISQIEEENIWSNHHRYLLHIQHFTQEVTYEKLDHTAQAQLASIWYYIGLVAEHSSHLTDAKIAYQQGLTIAQPLQLPLVAPLLAHAGVVISDLGNDEHAMHHLAQASDLAQTYNDEKTFCFVLLHQGQIQDNQGNYQQARDLYQQGLSVAIHLQSWGIASAFLQDLGLQFERRGDYEQATRFYQEGLSYAQQINQLARQSALLMNLGMVTIRQKQYEQALVYTLESLHIAQQIQNYYRISAVSQNLGIIYRHLNQIAQAQMYLDQSLQLAQLAQHRWLIAETQGEYGWLFLQEHKYREAQDAFQMMQVEAQSIQAPQLIAHALFGLAHVAARQNRQEQARSLAQDSLDLFTQLEDAERYRIIQWLDELALISE